MHLNKNSYKAGVGCHMHFPSKVEARGIEVDLDLVLLHVRMHVPLHSDENVIFPMLKIFLCFILPFEHSFSQSHGTWSFATVMIAVRVPFNPSNVCRVFQNVSL